MSSACEVSLFLEDVLRPIKGGRVALSFVSGSRRIFITLITFSARRGVSGRGLVDYITNSTPFSKRSDLSVLVIWDRQNKRFPEELLLSP